MIVKKQGRQTTETACGPRVLHCRLALPGTLGWTPFPDAPGGPPSRMPRVDPRLLPGGQDTVTAVETQVVP